MWSHKRLLFVSVRPIPNIRPNIRPKTADIIRPNIRQSLPIRRYVKNDGNRDFLSVLGHFFTKFQMKIKV